MRQFRDPKSFGNAVGFSPDGKWLAVSRTSGTVQNIWLPDLARGGAGTRFTFSSSEDADPVWSPDGRRIVYASRSTGKPRNLYQKVSDGSKSEELVLESIENKLPSSWSGDGRYLLYSSQNPKTGLDPGSCPWIADGSRFPS